MTDSMEWLRMFIVHYPSFQYIIIFVGTALIGELALFILGFLVAESLLPTFPVILFGFLGSFVPNIFWFFLGKTNAIHKLASYRHTNATFSVITDGVRRVSKGSHLFALIIIKFLVGTPVLLTMYANRTFLKWKEFFYYQSMAIILSMLVIIPIGYFSGRGFSYLTEVSQNLYTAIGFLLFIIVIIAVFQVWLEKRFTDTI